MNVGLDAPPDWGGGRRKGAGLQLFPLSHTAKRPAIKAFKHGWHLAGAVWEAASSKAAHESRVADMKYNILDQGHIATCKILFSRKAAEAVAGTWIHVFAGSALGV